MAAVGTLPAPAPRESTRPLPTATDAFLALEMTHRALIALNEQRGREIIRRKEEAEGTAQCRQLRQSLDRLRPDVGRRQLDLNGLSEMARHRAEERDGGMPPGLERDFLILVKTAARVEGDALFTLVATLEKLYCEEVPPITPAMRVAVATYAATLREQRQAVRAAIAAAPNRTLDWPSTHALTPRQALAAQVGGDYIAGAVARFGWQATIERRLQVILSRDAPVRDRTSRLCCGQAVTGKPPDLGPGGDVPSTCAPCAPVNNPPPGIAGGRKGRLLRPGCELQMRLMPSGVGRTVCVPPGTPIPVRPFRRLPVRRLPVFREPPPSILAPTAKGKILDPKVFDEPCCGECCGRLRARCLPTGAMQTFVECGVHAATPLPYVPFKSNACLRQVCTGRLVARQVAGGRTVPCVEGCTCGEGEDPGADRPTLIPPPPGAPGAPPGAPGPRRLRGGFGGPVVVPPSLPSPPLVPQAPPTPGVAAPCAGPIVGRLDEEGRQYSCVLGCNCETGQRIYGPGIVFRTL